MNTTIKKAAEHQGDYVVYVCGKTTGPESLGLPDSILAVLERERSRGKKILQAQENGKTVFVYMVEEKNQSHITVENCRVQGNNLLKVLNSDKAEEVLIVDKSPDKNHVLAFAEGMALGNYQFLKYFNKPDTKKNPLKTIKIWGGNISDDEVSELEKVVEHTLWARSLVNEPPCYLTAEQLSEELHQKGKELGFKVEIFNKMKIESLRMGGILAVNRGSKGHPTFTIMEHKPENPVNPKPFVFVGKGIVFDTGGVNIKMQNMEFMKADMGGAAGVAGAFCAIAAQKLPVHVVCLIPATDNRPGENAFVPGDVITMFDGTTVEVLNTDAEGRMILADALSYAKKYNPGLTIDVATLTGSSLRAIGTYGLAAMGNAPREIMDQLIESGNQVYERLVEFPFWDEYAEEIKSDIADLKNIGGPYASAITAGKFLEHFAPAPWVHLDIAGPSLNEHTDTYRGKGGTGYTVRLLYNFIKKQVIK